MSAPVGVDKETERRLIDVAASMLNDNNGKIGKKHFRADATAVVRRVLKALAQQPPAEAQEQGGGEVVYQAKDETLGAWYDVAKARWDNYDSHLRRAVYTTPPSAPVGVECAPIRYFAYDSDCGDYNEFDTLPEAIADAQEALDYAGDDGWPEGGPSIYYGAVLGEAREVEGSRRPAGPGDHPDADFIVEYELKGSDALAQQPAATLPDEDDSDLTVAYMAGLHDGRKESQQPAAVGGALTCECGPRSYACPICGSAFLHKQGGDT